MAFIDYRLSTSNKKFVVIPFRCCSNDQPVYVLASTNGWTAVEMAKVDTVDSDKRVYLYEHTVILPDDVSNIQYKFRVGENLYLHDESENATPDGFGGLNNTFEACWDPIYSISTHEPNPEPELSTTETPSGPDSLQVSEEETAPARNSQTPPVDLPAANNQELHSAPDSVLQAPKTLEAELVPTTPEANTEPEPEGSGYIRLEKVRTTSLDAIIMQIERSLEERTTKTELRKLCIDIIKDAVRHRTLAERLYGPTNEAEEEQEWADIYRNDDDEIVPGIQQDPSTFAAGIQNVGRFSHSKIISYYLGNLASLTDLRDPNPSPSDP